METKFSKTQIETILKWAEDIEGEWGQFGDPEEILLVKKLRNLLETAKPTLDLQQKLHVKIPLQDYDGECLGYVTLMNFWITLDLESIDKKTRILINLKGKTQ